MKVVLAYSIELLHAHNVLFLQIVCCLSSGSYVICYGWVTALKHCLDSLVL